MKQKICIEPIEAEAKLPPKVQDRSGIGVHYVDACLKPMNVVLENGAKVTCKRRGLKITLAVGAQKGEGLMRRLEVGPDPRIMLRAALGEAAKNAGVTLEFAEGAIWVNVNG